MICAPLQNGMGRILIPWETHLRIYEGYAKLHGTGQSPERIAERHGFGAEEANMFFPGWREHAAYNSSDRRWLPGETAVGVVKLGELCEIELKNGRRYIAEFVDISVDNPSFGFAHGWRVLVGDNYKFFFDALDVKNYRAAGPGTMEVG